MASDLKPAKRSYSPPSFERLDASTARDELKAKGEPKDANVKKMLSFIKRQLNRRKAGHIRSSNADIAER